MRYWAVSYVLSRYKKHEKLLERWGGRDFPNRGDDAGRMAKALQQVVL